MAIKTSDLVYLEEQVGYGAKVSLYRTDSGLRIEVGKEYEGQYWCGASINLTDEEVGNFNINESLFLRFVNFASSRFDIVLGGRFLK